MQCHLRPVCVLANQLLRHSRCIKQTARFSTMATDAVKSNPLIGVCQMTATSDREANFLTCQSLIQKAKDGGAQMVFLPEAFDFIGENRAQAIEYAETLDGQLIRRYKDLAQELCVWLSLGGFHQKGPPEDSNRISNVHVVIDNHGVIKKTYAKVHLFDVNIKDKVKLAESDHTIPGKEIVSPIQTDVGSVGLGICYDLRFPEMSLALRQQGAEILTYPSAFTVPTGEAHWEILLRCRAIETQCYVVAAAQTGQHNKKRASYGHAMIVDPWGKVVAECEEGTGVCITEVDVALLHKTRTEMSLWNHRRPDLYGQIQTVSPGDINSSQLYQIGQYSILSSCVFYRTAHSFACVNIKPVVPGHALVWTLRPVERLSNLTAAEISDLFLAVQRVSKVIEKHFGSTSVTVAIQDGSEAGQTVKHFHVHILPRQPGDFERNDQIYDELQKHDEDLDADRKNRKLRSDEEMATEANQLRKYFL